MSFRPESPRHIKARRYLAKRDGLTGLLVGEHLMKAIDEDGLFADWAKVPMQIAHYELCGQNRGPSMRPTILEMIALRKAAPRVVELTERP